LVVRFLAVFFRVVRRAAAFRAGFLLVVFLAALRTAFFRPSERALAWTEATVRLNFFAISLVGVVRYILRRVATCCADHSLPRRVPPLFLAVVFLLVVPFLLAAGFLLAVFFLVVRLALRIEHPPCELFVQNKAPPENYVKKKNARDVHFFVITIIINDRQSQLIIDQLS
jgi:hypothetical protein